MDSTEASEAGVAMVMLLRLDTERRSEPPGSRSIEDSFGDAGSEDAALERVATIAARSNERALRSKLGRVLATYYCTWYNDCTMYSVELYQYEFLRRSYTRNGKVMLQDTRYKIQKCGLARPVPRRAVGHTAHRSSSRPRSHHRAAAPAPRLARVGLYKDFFLSRGKF